MKRSRGFLLVIAACAACTSCTSSSSGTPASDAAIVADGATTGPDGATTGPDGGSASLACAATLDAFCASSSCIRHFADLPTCGVHLAATSHCGGYSVFSKLGVDTGEHSYYDGASGELVAIVSTGLILTRCLAGPGTFVVPACTEPSILLPPCPDAGP